MNRNNKTLKVHTVIQSGKLFKYIESGTLTKKGPDASITVTLYKAYAETYDVFGNKYFQFIETVQTLPLAIEQDVA